MTPLTYCDGPSKQMVTDLNTAADLHRRLTCRWAAHSPELRLAADCLVIITVILQLSVCECMKDRQLMLWSVLPAVCLLMIYKYLPFFKHLTIFGIKFVHICMLDSTAVLGIGIFEYFIQKCGVSKIFNVFERSLSPRLQLFDQKYSKNSNIMK